MLDYAGALVSAAEGLTHPIGLVGWSSGGLVALLAAEQIRPSSLVLLEASPPSEVQGSDADLQIGDGLFDPEAVYGPFPPGVWSRRNRFGPGASASEACRFQRFRARPLWCTDTSFPKNGGAPLPPSTAPRSSPSRIWTTGVSCSTLAFGGR